MADLGLECVLGTEVDTGPTGGGPDQVDLNWRSVEVLLAKQC